MLIEDCSILFGEKMKISKYIITFIIIFFALIFFAECHLIYTTNFLFQSNNIYYDIEIHDDNDIKLLNTMAGKDELIICIADIKKNYSKQKTKINIYTNAKKDIAKKFQVLQGEYKSIFINNVCIKVIPLSQYETKDITRVFVYGDEQAQIKFRRIMEENFNIIDGNVTTTSKTDTFYLILNIIQGIIIIFIFVLTLFSVILERKDHFIRIVNGESMVAIIVKSIFKEVIILLFQFSFIFSYLRFYDRLYLTYIDKYFICAITASCILPYLILLKFDYKHIINEQITLSRLLKFSYIYKTVLLTLMIIICVFASKISINFITEYKYYKSAEQFSNYVALQIRANDLDPIDNYEDFISETNKKTEEMYEELYYSNSPIISDLLSDNIIYCNAHFKNYLFDTLGDLNIGNEGIFLIIPEGKDVESLERQARSIVSQIEGLEIKNAIKTIVYNKNIDVISFSHDADSPIITTHNPCIVFNNIEPVLDKTHLKESRKMIIDTILYKKNEKLNEYIKENNSVDYNEINMSESIEYYLSKNRNICCPLILTCIAFIILVLTINTYIVKMEYRINSKEYCLKTILGYTIIQKFGGNILLSAISIFFSGILSFVIFYKNNISSIIIIGLCLLTFIFDFLLICFYSSKIENRSIVKCLKGEAM